MPDTNFCAPSGAPPPQSSVSLAYLHLLLTSHGAAARKCSGSFTTTCSCCVQACRAVLTSRSEVPSSRHRDSEMSYEQSKLTKLRRSVKRGSYDKVVVSEILDAALVAHVAYVDEEGQAKLSPMIFGREDESLFLHGHVSAGALRNGSIDVCFCVTLEDGLVLARANMHASMNYRSVIVHGQATEMPEEDAKRHALDVITDHMCRGRAKQARPMTAAGTEKGKEESQGTHTMGSVRGAF